MFDPRIDKHLIADQGEYVIDEVHKHWAALVSAILEFLGGIVIVLLGFALPADAQWLPAIIGGFVMAHGVWRMFEQHVDRFVITNMRVFRVHGILSQQIATMPLSRILDISVKKPFVGRIFGYGHFIFETAAQDQGLREIKYVGRPDERDLTIQRVIVQAGLRGRASVDPVTGVPMPSAPAAPSVVPARPQVSAAEAAALYENPDAGSGRGSDTAEYGWDAPPSYQGWEWIETARRREAARLEELRRDHDTAEVPPFDPDRTTTAPIQVVGPPEPQYRRKGSGGS